MKVREKERRNSTKLRSILARHTVWFVYEGKPRHYKHEESGHEDIRNKPASFSSCENSEVDGAVDFLSGWRGRISFKYFHTVTYEQWWWWECVRETETERERDTYRRRRKYFSVLSKTHENETNQVYPIPELYDFPLHTQLDLMVSLRPCDIWK